ncbi:Phosphatidylinositol transfer protein (PITP) [Elasticomyces elasticus]|nr:Phosphatidylinositol transfer protein (PITP) [Elasticomyces elasticus]KAK3658685.1 Phosphatidylinositol transfer protein (PITP) [Elasticomyces elasticus]KAK4913608.1 Phosphatidylinositol transfer protein (PITP) [Elasticomyces elasticus]KAK5756622.1 Phosphatidylinositol transfer protein (PITP) [Elasticomyces elasticus]
MAAPNASSGSSFKTTTSHTTDEWTPPSGTLKTPIYQPVKTAKPHSLSNLPLTSEQQTKYDTVLESVSQWTTVPATTAAGAPQAPLQDHERMWLTRECLLRYLRATKWHTPNALKRLQSTLSWRREYGADTFTADYISPENETGKQLVLGYDNEARPCLYLNPAKQNTKMSDRQIHHLCYMLDRTIDMMPPGQESACLLINFRGAGGGHVPTVAQARAVLNILQNHSPERLGKALISELPWYVSTFFKLISPFIDPVTREKMKFNEDLTKYIPKEQLWSQYGGKTNGGLDFEYSHDDYWPALEKEVQRRRAAYRERWEKGGKQIGEYEEYLRGGKVRSLVEVLKAEGGDGEGADTAAAGVARLTV